MSYFSKIVFIIEPQFPQNIISTKNQNSPKNWLDGVYVTHFCQSGHFLVVWKGCVKVLLWVWHKPNHLQCLHNVEPGKSLD